MKKLLIWKFKNEIKYRLIDLENTKNFDEIRHSTEKDGFYKYNNIRISDTLAFNILRNDIICNIDNKIDELENEIKELEYTKTLFYNLKLRKNNE